MSGPPGISPIGEWVLCERLPGEERSGSIIVSEQERARAGRLKARVLAVGRGSWTRDGERRPMPVVVGEVVVLEQKFCGYDLLVGGQEVFFTRAADIMGVLE